MIRCSVNAALAYFRILLRVTAPKLYRYSVNATEKEHLGRIKSDPVQCKRSLSLFSNFATCHCSETVPVQCKREGKGTLGSDQK